MTKRLKRSLAKIIMTALIINVGFGGSIDAISEVESQQNYNLQMGETSLADGLYTADVVVLDPNTGGVFSRYEDQITPKELTFEVVESISTGTFEINADIFYEGTTKYTVDTIKQEINGEWIDVETTSLEDALKFDLKLNSDVLLIKVEGTKQELFSSVVFNTDTIEIVIKGIECIEIYEKEDEDIPEIELPKLEEEELEEKEDETNLDEEEKEHIEEDEESEMEDAPTIEEMLVEVLLEAEINNADISKDGDLIIAKIETEDINEIETAISDIVTSVLSILGESTEKEVFARVDNGDGTETYTIRFFKENSRSLEKDEIYLDIVVASGFNIEDIFDRLGIDLLPSDSGEDEEALIAPTSPTTTTTTSTSNSTSTSTSTSQETNPATSDAFIGMNVMTMVVAAGVLKKRKEQE